MQQIWEKSFGFFYDGLKVPKSPFYLSPIWTVAVNYLISVVSHKRRFSVPRVIITGLSSISQLSVVFFHRKKHLCIKLLLSATWEICHILLLFNCHEMSKWADEGRQWNIEDYSLAFSCHILHFLFKEKSRTKCQFNSYFSMLLNWGWRNHAPFFGGTCFGWWIHAI